jgi:hypothetical protein
MPRHAASRDGSPESISAPLADQRLDRHDDRSKESA